MEYQKIINLLDTTFDNVPRFNTKQWICNINKQIRFKTSMLRSELCDCSDVYIVVKRTVNVTDQNNNVYDKKLAFKNNVPLFLA